MEKKMSKKKIVILCILAAVIIGLLIGVIGYISGWFEKGYDADVVTVSQRNVIATYDTSGKVSASSEGVFKAVDGIKVNSVNAKVGQRVKKGDVLATFDTSSLSSLISEKQSDLAKAQKAYNDYKSASAQAKANLITLDKKIAEAQATVDRLEKQAESAKKTTANPAKNEKEKASAQANLSSIINDSTLAGKIIDGIINSNSTLSQIKSTLDALSSMSNGSQLTSIMGNMGAGSAQYELMQAQLELATLKANKTAAEAQASGSLESVYKSVVDAAQKSYDSVKATADTLNTGWIAENDGVVSEVNITAGETIKAESLSAAPSFDVSTILSSVTSGQNIADLISGLLATDVVGIKVQYYPLEISFMINKGDIDKVTVGKKVKVKSETGEILEGEVSYVSAIAEASGSMDFSSLLGSAGGSSSGIAAKVTVEKPDNGVIIGFDTDISIDVEEKQKCLTVPVESIQYDDKNAYVYVYNKEEETITKKTVETGIFDGTYYEIISGISAGDIIVRTPTAAMKDQDRIIAHNVDNVD